MDVDVVTNCVINRDIAMVAQFAADPDKVPAWYANIKHVEWETERPPEKPARRAEVTSFLSSRLGLSASHD